MRRRRVLARATDTDGVTDTIGWGDVDSPPRRLPRLTRRRRIALVAVGALVAAGIVAWPSFTSWRADDAARHVQHLWARAQGFDNARILALAGVQSRLGVLDQPAFAHAVALIEDEEAADLDRLARQAKSLRTWTSDVAAARRLVVIAMVKQAAALRAQAGNADLPIYLPITSTIDAPSGAALGLAAAKIDALQAHRHLKAVAPTTEHFHSATRALAMLRRPTDQPLHLRLVAAGLDGVTVTDLDTGRVVHRVLDTTNPEGFQPMRLFGNSVVGSVDGATLFIPLNVTGRERLIPNGYPASSIGSPLWLSALGSPALQAVDESGRPVGRRVNLPANFQVIGTGTGSVLPASALSTQFNGPDVTAPYYLFRPATKTLTKLATMGCAQIPTLAGRIVVVPASETCGSSDELQLFDLSGRALRVVKLPAGESASGQVVCSPDGAEIAVATSLSPDAEVPGTEHVRLLDARTGTWTRVDDADGWIPAAWSSDGTTLLLQLIDNSLFLPGQQYGQLAYLRVGDPTLHSVRVAADLGNYLS